MRSVFDRDSGPVLLKASIHLKDSPVGRRVTVMIGGMIRLIVFVALGCAASHVGIFDAGPV